MTGSCVSQVASWYHDAGRLTFADELESLGWLALHFVDFRETHLGISEVWVGTYDYTNDPVSVNPWKKIWCMQLVLTPFKETPSFIKLAKPLVA